MEPSGPDTDVGGPSGWLQTMTVYTRYLRDVVGIVFQSLVFVVFAPIGSEPFAFDIYRLQLRSLARMC